MKTKSRRGVGFGLLVAISVTAFHPLVAQAVTYVPRRLDGVVVSEKNANLRPLAVIIDNDWRARPQASLRDASVVYETLAEGGIPRYMAVFAKPKVGLIGPVRSIRPYFAELAAEYNAPIIHAGGSRDGLSRVKQLKLTDIDGLKRTTAKYFYRVGPASATYTLFTDGKTLARATKDLKVSKKAPTYEGWLFDEKSRPKKLPNRQAPVTIDWGAGRNYLTQYRFDRTRNSYLRAVGGTLQRDRVDGKLVRASNVILQYVPKEKLLDRKGHLKVNVLGRGNGVLLKDGKSLTIRWQKLTPGQRTVYTTTKGDPITFRKGTTYVEIVPKGKRVSFK